MYKYRSTEMDIYITKFADVSDVTLKLFLDYRKTLTKVVACTALDDVLASLLGRYWFLVFLLSSIAFEPQVLSK